MTTQRLHLVAPVYRTRADLMARPAWASLCKGHAGNPCVWHLTYSCVCGDRWSNDFPDHADDTCPTCGSVNGPDDDPTWIGPIDSAELALWCNLPEAE